MDRVYQTTFLFSFMFMFLGHFLAVVNRFSVLQALLEYEKYKMRSGELPFSDAPCSEPSSTGNQVVYP